MEDKVYWRRGGFGQPMHMMVLAHHFSSFSHLTYFSPPFEAKASTVTATRTEAEAQNIQRIATVIPLHTLRPTLTALYTPPEFLVLAFLTSLLYFQLPTLHK